MPDAAGVGFFEGTTGFVRADYERGKARVRAFCNRGEQALKDFRISQVPQATSRSLDLTLERALSLPFRNRLVMGAGYRRNALDSNAYSPNRVRQNLWALFFEDAWRPRAALSVVASARLDRHPLTGWVFSPRASLVFSRTDRQAFRFSAGSSFRNPTLTENYVALKQAYGSALSLPIDIEVLGTRDQDPERMVLAEVAYNGRFGPLKTTAAGFLYRLKDVISVVLDRTILASGDLSRITLRSFYDNYEGETRAWGGELGAELSLSRQVTAFANASFQHFGGELDFMVPDNGGPAHKVNGGVRVRSGGLTVNLWVHRVGDTVWNSSSLRTFGYEAVELDGYTLLNAHIGYAFSGRLKGLEAGADAFNLADSEHAEILPATSDIDLGQGGEVIRRRLTASVAYRF